MYGTGTVLTILLVAAPPSPDDIGRAQRDVLQDAGYQTTWSDEETIRRPTTENWRGNGGGRGGGGRWDWEERRQRRPEGDAGLDGEPPRQIERSGRSSGRSSGSTGEAIESVLWIALAAVVILLVLAFMRAWWRVPKEVEPKANEAKPKPKPVALERPLSEAERFADEGRYAEAVHVLLLETMTALQSRVDSGVPDSLTSREVLRSVSMPNNARPALGRLVDTVERSLFGGEAVAQADYETCTASFAEFRAAYESAHA